MRLAAPSLPRVPALLVAVALALGGCAGSGPAKKTDATLPPAEPDVKLEEVVGFWSGEWGNLVLQQIGDTVWGAYTHRDGTLVGRLSGGTLKGWWTEEPSRAPDGEAGEVELAFVRRAGKLTLLGRYRAGTSGTWHEEWNLTRVDGAAPPELEARFADSTLFHPHP